MPRENRPRDDVRTKLYNSAAWKRLRAFVLERDGYRCVRCGKAANTVHHVRAITEGGAPLDEGNCETLCHECHGAADGVRAHKAKAPKVNRFMRTVMHTPR